MTQWELLNALRQQANSNTKADMIFDEVTQKPVPLIVLDKVGDDTYGVKNDINT